MSEQSAGRGMIEAGLDVVTQLPLAEVNGVFAESLGVGIVGLLGIFAGL